MAAAHGLRFPRNWSSSIGWTKTRAFEVAAGSRIQVGEEGLPVVKQHGGSKGSHNPARACHYGHADWDTYAGPVCAMLFAATRSLRGPPGDRNSQPTLEHSIGMTEVGYGYIVDAFQIAYAIGLLVAGRLIDKLGTRHRYNAGDGDMEPRNGPRAGWPR